MSIISSPQHVAATLLWQLPWERFPNAGVLMTLHTESPEGLELAAVKIEDFFFFCEWILEGVGQSLKNTLLKKTCIPHVT